MRVEFTATESEYGWDAKPKGALRDYVWGCDPGKERAIAYMKDDFAQFIKAAQPFFSGEPSEGTIAIAVNQTVEFVEVDN